MRRVVEPSKPWRPGWWAKRGNMRREDRSERMAMKGREREERAGPNHVWGVEG